MRHFAWFPNDLFAIVSGSVDTDDGTHDDFRTIGIRLSFIMWLWMMLFTRCFFPIVVRRSFEILGEL